ncbi:MAG: hypothetical protein ACETVR_03040 [Candidatus Bathyarchaeia archaeon]
MREVLPVLPYILFILLLAASCSSESSLLDWILRLDATVMVLIPFYVLWSWKEKLRSNLTFIGVFLAIVALWLMDALPGVHLSQPIFSPRLYLCGYHIHHHIIASYILTLTHLTSKTPSLEQALGKDNLKGLFRVWMGFWLLVWVSQIPEIIIHGINPLYP